MRIFRTTTPNIRRNLLLIFSALLLFTAKASHNRAGEIYYTRIAPFTANVGGTIVQVYTYSIVVVKYHDFGPQIAFRCQDSVFFGDGKFGLAPRINGPKCSDCNTSVGGVIPTCGEKLLEGGDYNVKKSVYTIIHTYSGPGRYLIHSLDPNRNKGVKNIPNSDNLPFYVEALLIINSFTGANSSPIFTFPPVDKACKGYCFEHNPGAYDPDGDSLSYELTTSRGANGQTVFGYFFPDFGTGPGAKYEINAETGLLSWCNPQEQGEFNIAFIVREWRKNTSGKYDTIGYVLRDMQVIVATCPTNAPPKIDIPADTCVEAGALIERNIYISDPNIANTVTLTADGGAFKYENPRASLSVTSGSGSGFYTKFTWQTTCDHVQHLPYYTTFYATDNGSPTKLATYRTYVIKVLPPSVKDVTAAPVGSGIRINWSLSTCNPANNPITGYKIYRKNDCSPFVFVPCKTDIADTTGFETIGTVAPTVSTFLDDNNGDGLVVGQDYSYVIVAVYKDGTQTYGSSQVCTKLKRDVPVITNVDVLTTSATTGQIKIKWTRPLTTPGNLDLIAFPGPYAFNLNHKKADGSYEIVFTSLRNQLDLLDVEFTHSGINTQDIGHEYFVEFVSGTVTVGNSQKATSVFLTTVPSDRRVDLSWEAKTPWKNYNYKIFRKGPSEAGFTLLTATTKTSFADSVGLSNDSVYCYRILSEGEFSDNLFPKPLLNNSQESCSKTKDLTPPCVPLISLDADCPTGFVKVIWTDVSKCYRSDDVAKYELYYKPTVNEEYSKVTTVDQKDEHSYLYDGLGLISGCYAIKAMDVNGNISALSPDFCVDNCPEYTLPNIFTPNGDGVNEHFKAIKNRQIKEIDLVVFDRWGNLVYKSKDPYFKWDGVSIMSKQKVSDGTFFYICDVFEPRLTGVVKRTLKGYLEVAK